MRTIIQSPAFQAGIPSLLILNALFTHNAIVGAILVVAYICTYGLIIASLIFKKQLSGFTFMIGVTVLLAVYSLVTTAIFYIYQLDNLTLLGTFVCITALLQYIAIREKCSFQLITRRLEVGAGSAMLFIVYIATAATLIYILAQSRTDMALFSPWDVLPPYFVMLYAGASWVLALLLAKHRSYLSGIATSIHVFITLGVALIVYKLGYGFDPLIHHATEQLLHETGTINPKPLYYIGQYGLFALLSQLSQLPSQLIDTFFVPIFAALAIPPVLHRILANTTVSKAFAGLGVLTFLIIPFDAFINTTPYSLALLFALLGVCVSIPILQREYSPWILCVLALATLAVHPIVGIPLTAYWVIVLLWNSAVPFRTVLIIIFTALTATAIPTALLIGTLIGKVQVQFGLTTVTSPTPPTVIPQYLFFLDSVYAIQQMLPYIIITLTLIAILALRKHHELRPFAPLLLLAAAGFVNALLLLWFVTFPTIAVSEQHVYALRLISITVIFLLPLVAIGAAHIIRAYLSEIGLMKFFCLTLITVLLCGSVYLRYPRHDDYQNSGFVSVSKADYDVVRYIEERAAGSYVVLANQMTSGAALDMFGFSRSFKTASGEYYFYPIPTGGPLYQLFEQLLQSPDTALIESARTLTGADEVFVVLPHYWSRFPILNAQLQKEATAVASIDNVISVYSF